MCGYGCGCGCSGIKCLLRRGRLTHTHTHHTHTYAHTHTHTHTHARTQEVEPSAYATLVHKFQEQQKAAGMASHDLWEDPISIIQQQQEQQGVKFQFEITWNPSQPWGAPSGQEVVQVLHESLKRRCVCVVWLVADVFFFCGLQLGCTLRPRSGSGTA